jgi:NADH:flavin oxidoreductases, Old Yellow Enzyme family
MFSTGIVSVTFRKLSVDAIISAAVDNKLAGIEWGGDIHIPPNDIENAKNVAMKCAENELKIFSYGSYYALGQDSDFTDILNTAIVLNTPNIRIWAGKKNSEDVTAGEWNQMVEETRVIADKLAEHNITLSFEYHGNTLTNTPESAVKLMTDVNRNNVKLYWQPNQYKDVEWNKAALRMVLPYLTNVHVFNWNGNEKLPLEDASKTWTEYINIIKADNKFHNLLLEFVKDDSMANFEADSAALNKLLENDIISKINYYKLDIPYKADTSILSKPVFIKGDNITLKNAVTTHPMEGFDGDLDGSPGELTFRRYKRFAESGASLIWFEAVAVQEDARTCSRQLWMHEDNLDSYKRLIETIKEISDVPVIMQLTHSGRFSKPHDVTAPVIAYHNPIMNRKLDISPDHPVVTDDYLDRLEEQFIRTSELAKSVGFDGVDVKACHRYLLSELLSAHIREGKHGGSYENRTRLFKNIIKGVKQANGSDYIVGSRFGIYDAIDYPYGFGVDKDDYTIPDLSEPIQLLKEIHALGVNMIDVTMGTPYFNPHVNRPFSKGTYLPPEDPLWGVERLIKYTGIVQQAIPDMTFIGTGYTYLNKYSPSIAAAAIEAGWIKCVGYGRMAFAYDKFAEDIVNGKFDNRKSCVTCGKCTEIMRAHGTTGCPVRDKLYTPIYLEYCGKK